MVKEERASDRGALFLFVEYAISWASMKVIMPGIHYQMENFVDGSHQEVFFTSKYHRIIGTTNEEMVDVLIDRLHHLQKINFSPNNAKCIELLLKVRAEMKARRIYREKKYGDTRLPKSQFGAEEAPDGLPEAD